MKHRILQALAVTLAALGITASVACAGASPEIIAHRGASFAAPENTMASAKLAWGVGTDAVEIDIYLTADNHIVVCHDGNTRRTTGVDLKISRSTFDQIRSLDAGKWKGEKWAGERIPTLEEELKALPDGKRLFIEIKCGSEIVPELLKTLDASGKKEEQIVVISFDADAVRAVEQKRPSLKTYLLCSPKPGNVDKLIRKARVIGADGIDGQVTGSFDAGVVAKIREAKMGLYVWTVDDEPTIRRLADLGVDGITTNKPAEVRGMLEKR